MKIRDSEGVLVLTLGDSAHVGGYLVTDEYRPGARVWRRTTTSAPRVDYEFELTKARANVSTTLAVDVIGANEAEVKTRVDALLDAVEGDLWLLDVDGDGTSDVWLCDAADSEVTRYPDGSRSVVLTIPARPAY